MSIYSMKEFEGVQIDVKELAGVSIKEDQTSAILQAGTYGGEVMSKLWDEGYVAGKSPLMGFELLELTASNSHRCS